MGSGKNRHSGKITDDIQRIIWGKLFVNLSINTFTDITRSPIGSMIDNKYAWDFAEKIYNVPVPYNSLIADLIHAIEGAYKYQTK